MELHKYWGVGGRRCGSCEGAPAAVHCRTCVGGSFLCTTCDARPAHARLGHERVWMCEVCELAPAAVTCKADAAVLCAACDSDIHDANPLARRHARVPVAPIGSEAAAAAVEAMLFGTGEAAVSEADEQHAAAEQQQHAHALNLNVEAKDMKLDYLFSELDPYLSVEIPRFQHADSVVPNGAGAAVELDFTCGIGVKHSSYSSYTATSLAHSVSFALLLPCLAFRCIYHLGIETHVWSCGHRPDGSCRAPRRRLAWCQRPSAAAAAAAGALSSTSQGPSLRPTCHTPGLPRATA